MYIPRDIILFILGFVSCVILSGFFTLVVDKEEYKDIDIKQDIRKFKEVIKNKFKKGKIEEKKPEEKKKLTKRQVKKKLKKMFKD